MGQHLRVYLGGPIEGLTYEDATEWRASVKERLAYCSDVSFYDPMMNKEHLQGKGIITATMPDRDEHFSCRPNAVFHRDVAEIRRCDILLINLMHLNQSTTGTFFEEGLAYGLGKMIIIVNAGPRAHHPFISVPSIVLDDMDDVVELIRSLAGY